MVIRCPHCRTTLSKQEIKDHKCPNCSCEIKITTTTSILRHATSSSARTVAPEYFTDVDYSSINENNHIIKDDSSKLQVNTNLRNFSIYVNEAHILSRAAPNEHIDYEITETIGSGGMGIVLKATQKAIGRNVAIKLTDTEKRIDPQNCRKLCNEAAITGRLEHPNIVPIYDLGLNEENNVFYAMKLVDGTPWCDIIEAKSLQENIEILLSVCNGVAFAHNQGVIHRDLKPDNIMLGKFAEVLITDWGLAAGTSDESFAPRVTYEDAIAGTPAYMAPEMALGYENKINESSDIYLLGAILFEILTGQVPHSGDSIIQCVNSAATNTIEEPWVKSELLKTAMKAMATNRQDRYSCVEEFREAIKTHFESVAISTRAKKVLSQGRISKDYGEILKAILEFQNAIEKWHDNEDAKHHLNDATELLASCAKEQGDESFMQKISSLIR